MITEKQEKTVRHIHLMCNQATKDRIDRALRKLGGLKLNTWGVEILRQAADKVLER